MVLGVFVGVFLFLLVGVAWINSEFHPMLRFLRNIDFDHLRLLRRFFCVVYRVFSGFRNVLSDG